MPHILRDGERLYFETRGRPGGMPIVMQHSLCSNLHHFDDTTLPERLLERGYFLIFPESIAHGRSGVPVDQRRYAIEERARDVLAIVDHLDMDRFAYVGYSMGAWIGCGVAKVAPERILGLSFGGFDIMNGSHSSGVPRRLTASRFGRAMLAGYARHPISRIQPGEVDLEAVRRCFMELYEPMPPLSIFERVDGPRLLWSGARDLYCKPMKRAADILDARFVSFPGHHLSASSDERLVPPILELIESARTQHV